MIYSVLNIFFNFYHVFLDLYLNIYNIILDLFFILQYNTPTHTHTYYVHFKIRIIYD